MDGFGCEFGVAEAACGRGREHETPTGEIYEKGRVDAYLVLYTSRSAVQTPAARLGWRSW